MENISFITLTNDGYKHYTLNCLTSLKKIGLGEKLKVYCLGDNVYQDIKTNHNNCIKMENSDNLDKMFSYNDKGWNLITYNKFNIIHKELLENEFVCFTDGDIVYENNDIFKYVSIACILILFWPIMSTGSLIKNWNGVLTFYIIAICISLNRVKINN